MKGHQRFCIDSVSYPIAFGLNLAVEAWWLSESESRNWQLQHVKGTADPCQDQKVD